MSLDSPSLTLTISWNREEEEWKIQSIKSDANDALWLDDEGILGQSRPGVEALCLLVLLTYLSRLEESDPNQPDSIPARFAPALQVLYSGNRKSPSSWQERIFSCQPFGPSKADGGHHTYLVAKKVNGRPRVHIGKHVSVEVVVDQKDSPRTGMSETDLVKICADLVDPPKDSAVTVKLSIDGQPSIHSSECLGEINRSSRFSIIVEGDARNSFCVIWMGGHSGVEALYPFSKWDLIYDETEHKRSDYTRRRRVEITAEQLLEIDSSQGVETCLVLEKKSGFTKPELTRIQENLQSVSFSIPKKLKNNRPRFTPLTIPKRRFSSRRIKPVSKPAEWHREISSALSALAEKGYLLEVPYI